LLLVLLGCARVPPPAAEGERVGKFVFAGPTGGQLGKASVRWAYGFEYAVDPKTVTKVTLSCGAIQGTSVVVTGEDVLPDPNGTAWWYGPDYLLRDDAVPWLFSGDTTSAICQAVVSRDGQPDAAERIPVTFTKANKREMVINLRNATGFENKRSAQPSEPPSD
jgi:hypothetical protein